MIHKTRLLLLLASLALAVWLAACVSTPSEPTPTLPQPTATLPPPTDTPEPTRTPVPEPSLSNLEFSVTKDMADPRSSGASLRAGPQAIFASFEYADVPPGSRMLVQLKRSGVLLYEKDESWDAGGSGTASVPIVDDARILIPGSYALRITLAERHLAGSFSISATKGEPGARLAVDRFDDNLLEWDQFEDEESAATIENGRLEVGEYQSGYYIWTSLPPVFEDFDLAVDVQQVEGPADGYYGIVFRDGRSGHYFFSVSVDGFLEVELVTGDDRKSLVSHHRSNAVKRGAEINRLRVVASGSNFAFYVNDVYIATVTDDTLRRGTIGLLSGSYDQAGMVASFDNLDMILPLEAVEVVPAPAATVGPRPTPAPAATPTPQTPPLLATVQETLNHVHAIGGAMDRIYHEGRPEACAPLLFDYYSVVNAPAYDVAGQPPNVQGAYGLYREAIGVIADKISKIRDVCESGGGVIGELDFDISRIAINDAGDRLEQALRLLP